MDYAQNFKDLDSLLIDRDIDNYSIRFFTNYKVNKFSVLNSYYDVKFTPNNRHGIGFGVANKKMILDIGFNLKNPNKEETARFDFQGTAIIKKRNYTDLYIQSYKGFQAKNNFGESSVFRGDMRSVSFGFNYLYTLDEIEFSYSLLKAGLLDEDDKDVFITGGLGVFGMFDYFSSDTSVLSEIALEYYNEQADIKRYQGVTVGVMGGAISYFKIKEDIRAAVNIMPGVGVMSKKITLQDGDYKPEKPILYKLDFSLGLAYQLDRLYACLTYNNGLYATDFGYDNNYRLNIGNAKLALGYRLGQPNKKRKLKQSLFEE
ncbi:MAG: hypothetical protein CMC76_08545 [Flavobacteriaceae bacterium]|nr:hypothetical protein [Flavobacteriaceae bacterium]